MWNEQWSHLEEIAGRVTANRYKIAQELTQGLEAAADARKILWWPVTLNRLSLGKGKSNPNCYCCGKAGHDAANNHFKEAVCQTVLLKRVC